MRKVPIPTLLTASVVVLVLLVYALTFEVRFSEVAVRIRFGNVVDIVKDPYIYPKWPWPIERIKKYDKRLRTLDMVEGEIKTKDAKNVVVGNFAVWRIDDPELFYTAVTTVPKAEEQLRARIAQRRAAVVGTENLSAFVNLNEEQVIANHDRIESAILHGRQTEDAEEGRSLYDGVLADFGIHLEKVGLRRISLPEETTESVSQQMIQERTKEAERFRAEGKSRAASITAQAEGAARQIRAFAERRAAEHSAKGIEASTRTLAQIDAEDAGFFEWLRWLDALRVSLQQNSTIFLDNNSPLFDHFVTPPAFPEPEAEDVGE